MIPGDTPVDTVLVIDTPEHVGFKVRVAGPARRGFAWGVDLGIRAVIFAGLTWLLMGLFSVAGISGLGSGLLLISLFLLNWCYFLAAELLTGGRSPGKMFFGLRVVREDGLPITWRESMLRTLLRGADLIIFPPHLIALPLGAVVMAFDEKFRRLGDHVAGTVVVVEERVHLESKVPLAHDDALVDAMPAVLPLDREDLEGLELFVSRKKMGQAIRDDLAKLVGPVYAERLGMVERRHTLLLASIWRKAQHQRRRGQGKN